MQLQVQSPKASRLSGWAVAKEIVPQLKETIEGRGSKVVTRVVYGVRKHLKSTTLGQTTMTVLMAAPFQPFKDALSLFPAKRLLLWMLDFCARTAISLRARSSPFRAFAFSCSRTSRCFRFPSRVILDKPRSNR